MEGFVGVRGVIAPRRLRELSRRSDARGLIQTASHLGAIAASAAALAYTWGTWWGVPFFVLLGMLINQLYAGEHECYHGTAFRSRWLNDWFGRLFGFLVVYPSDYDKWNHFAHHANTQDWEKDPELYKRKPFTSPWGYLWMFTGIPYFYGHFAAILRQATGDVPDYFLNERQRRLVVLAARWHVVGYVAILAASLAFQSWWAVMFWFGPMVATKWIYWFQGLAEHTGLSHEPNTLLNTRTFRTNAFMRWVHWNMTYHTIHHTFPAVPFFNLPRLHAEVTATYPHPLPEVGYLRCQREILGALLSGRTEHDMVADAEARYAAAMAAE